MAFFTPIKEFTHFARFYGVPCYLRFEEDGFPVIAGTNAVFGLLLIVATFFHNQIVERGAQFFAAITGKDYEPGFPIMVWDMVYEDDPEKNK